MLFFYKGDGKNAVRHVQSAIEYFEKSQASNYLPFAWGLLGQGYHLLGKLDAALEFAEKGLKMQTDTGLPVRLSMFHVLLSGAHLDLGNMSEARRHAEQGLDLAGQASKE